MRTRDQDVGNGFHQSSDFRSAVFGRESSVFGLQAADSGPQARSNRSGHPPSRPSPLLPRELCDNPNFFHAGVFQFVVTGPINTNYILWGSSNLTDWTPLQTNFVIDGILRFSDPDVVTRPQRFFRGSFGP